MTISLGFSIGVNEIQAVCLSGTRAAPTFEGNSRVLFPAGVDQNTVGDWSEKQLALLLDEYAPTNVSYKLRRDATSVREISRVYFSYGSLTTLCVRKPLPITNYNAPVRPERLGLARGADPRAHITTLIGAHPPNWNTHAQDAAIVAFLSLP